MRFPQWESPWRLAPIQDAAPLQRGFDLPASEIREGTVPVVYSNGILRFHDEGKAIGPGVVTGRSGTIGKFTFIKEGQYWPHNTSLWVTNFKGNDPWFIFYAFQKVGFKKYATGSGVPTLNRNDVMRHIIGLPEADEQRKITSLLKLIDVRIRAQNKIIEELATLRKGIVNQFFNSRKNGHSTPLSHFLNERKTFAEKDGEYEHVTLSKEGIIPKTDRYDRDFLVKDEEKQYKITLINDICYNPANLKFGVVCLNDYGSAIFSPIYVTFEVSTIDPRYIAFFLKSTLFMNQALRFEQGTVYERMSVSPDDFTRIKIPLASNDQRASFVRLVQQLIDKETSEKEMLHLLQLQKVYLLQNMFI